MILADTTLVIDYLRSPTQAMVKIIQVYQAAICGATLAEVYAGARSPSHFKKYDSALTVFRSVSIPKSIWPKLGKNLALLASKGVVVPFADALIATVALEKNLELWHHDRHFLLIQQVIPSLQLFHAPPKCRSPPCQNAPNDDIIPTRPTPAWLPAWGGMTLSSGQS
jgi:predicted nucleic acid-binding protein